MKYYLVYSNEIDNWDLFGIYDNFQKAESDLMLHKHEYSALVIEEFELNTFYTSFSEQTKHWYRDGDKMELQTL